MDPAELAEVFRTPPALHRFPGAMAGRAQELARAIADDYGNDAAARLDRGDIGKDLEARLLGLPGIGDMKAKALSRSSPSASASSRPAGRRSCRPTRRSGDVDSPESLAAYQAGKRAKKAELAGRPRPTKG